MRVLIVEDEPLLADAIRDGLRLEAIAADVAGDGDTALALLDVNTYDIAVLDRDIPGPSGDEVAARIVASGSGMPILMLTAASGLDDKVSGFELGADDYLTKPFSPRTLLARVKALLRRAGVDTATPLAAGRIRLDVDEHTVQVGTGDPIRLTKLELRLLQMLLANSGHTVGSDRLLMQVWGHRGAGDRQLLKQLVHRLRHKIEVDPAVPQLLQTAPGAGYRLIVD